MRTLILAWFARASSAAVIRTTSPSPRPASVNPAAPAANDRPGAIDTPQARVRGALVGLLTAVAAVPLDDATRAYFRAQLTDDVAAKRGRAIGPDDLLHDVVADLPGVVEAVLAGRVPGFTAASLRYTVELAVALADHRAARARFDRSRATASSQKKLSTREVLACRTELVRRTADVLAGDAPERETLARAAKLPSRTLDRALGAVEDALAVVESVLARGDESPAFGHYLGAMGFTRASVAAVVAPVQPALDARTAHREARTSGGVTQQEIDRLEGRLHAQLFRLRERVAAARKRGEVLPTVQASRMRTVKRGPKTAKPATPAGAPTQPKAAKRAKRTAAPAPAPAVDTSAKPAENAPSPATPA